MMRQVWRVLRQAITQEADACKHTIACFRSNAFPRTSGQPNPWTSQQELHSEQIDKAAYHHFISINSNAYQLRAYCSGIESTNGTSSKQQHVPASPHQDHAGSAASLDSELAFWDQLDVSTHLSRIRSDSLGVSEHTKVFQQACQDLFGIQAPANVVQCLRLEQPRSYRRKGLSLGETYARRLRGLAELLGPEMTLKLISKYPEVLYHATEKIRTSYQSLCDSLQSALSSGRREEATQLANHLWLTARRMARMKGDVDIAKYIDRIASLTAVPAVLLWDVMLRSPQALYHPDDQLVQSQTMITNWCIANQLPGPDTYVPSRSSAWRERSTMPNHKPIPLTYALSLPHLTQRDRKRVIDVSLGQSDHDRDLLRLLGGHRQLVFWPGVAPHDDDLDKFKEVGKRIPMPPESARLAMISAIQAVPELVVQQGPNENQEAGMRARQFVRACFVADTQCLATNLHKLMFKLDTLTAAMRWHPPWQTELGRLDPRRMARLLTATERNFKTLRRHMGVSAPLTAAIRDASLLRLLTVASCQSLLNSKPEGIAADEVE